MDFDQIEALASEAIKQIQQGNQTMALVLLGEIKGQSAALLGIVDLWAIVQEEYETGANPRDLACKYKAYGLTTKAIYNRAYTYRWTSPLKIKRASTPAKGKKNIFYPICRECESHFEAYSGHAIICNNCKALKALTKGKQSIKTS